MQIGAYDPSLKQQSHFLSGALYSVASVQTHPVVSFTHELQVDNMGFEIQ